MKTEKKHFIVKDIIESQMAITSDDGNKVYERIYSPLSQGEVVVLDFQGINFLITAFLNTAIGKLYQDFDGEFLNKYLYLINVEAKDKPLFKMVVQRAKEYFANKEDFENVVENVF